MKPSKQLVHDNFTHTNMGYYSVMQPRYFIGFTLPQALSDKISTLQHELLLPGQVMEPLVPHITLLDPNALQTLSPLYFIPRVIDTVSKLLPFEIILKSTGMFNERILYITIVSPDISQLQEKLAALLPPKVHAQYSLGRSFVPHVTLVQAKPKQILPADLINSFRNGIKNLLPSSFTVDHLSQFTWMRPRYYEIKKI